MSDLRELYQEVIFDHNRKPRNFGRLTGANRSAEGVNPLCGDKLTLYLKMADGVIEDVSFEGTGCAISTASASLMTESLKVEVRRALATLSEREAEVIRLYFGLDREHSLTLEEIGEKFNLTRERVRQIKEKAIRRLRHASRSKQLRAYLG